MTALAAASHRRVPARRFDKNLPHGVKAEAVVFAGSALCLESADGFARPIAQSLTAPEFLGFALKSADATGLASGALVIEVAAEGILELAAIAGMTGVTHIGDTVYMADDGDAFTGTSTNNVAIGKVVAFASGIFYVHFQAHALRSL